MNARLRVANVLRWIARVLSTLLILPLAEFLTCAGLQIRSGEESGGWLGWSVLTLFMTVMLAQLLIAWWREGLAALIAVLAFVGLVALGGVLETSWIMWAVTLVPAALFAVSWWLRRKPGEAAPSDNQPDRLQGARQS